MRKELRELKRLYVVAGPNGAGKTHASYTILPDMLNLNEFVNADEIARGLSPLCPDNAALPAGRLMLLRIKTLLAASKDFAFETTLATRSYVSLLEEAKSLGYHTTLLFFWLPSTEHAIRRVKIRVREGGHHIPEEIVRRRYERGLKNFFSLYANVVDDWLLVDSSKEKHAFIAGQYGGSLTVVDQVIWKNLVMIYG